MSRMLPQYDQWETLGHGGMGAVYRARQINLDRRVAIKILPPEAADDEAQFIERFKNEARTMAKLNHPAIVAVYDFGETTEGQLYFVMEYVDGTDVSKMIEEQDRLPPEHALAITAHVCDALQYAHDRNVIHRDIKPANILINREGEVKVADFGLAKMNDPANALGLTKSGMAMGTPDFVAPEALMLGVTVDHRADLYAVGVMLYQMLTGKIPRGVFSAASRHVPGLDPRFDDVIMRAMAEDREERYQSAGEIRRDLDTILSTPFVAPKKQFSLIAAPPPQVEPVHAIQQHTPLPQPVRRSTTPPPPKKSGAGFIVLLGAIAVLAAGAVYFLKKPKPLPGSQDSAVAVPSSQAQCSRDGPSCAGFRSPRFCKFDTRQRGRPVREQPGHAVCAGAWDGRAVLHPRDASAGLRRLCSRDAQSERRLEERELRRIRTRRKDRGTSGQPGELGRSAGVLRMADPERREELPPAHRSGVELRGG